MALFMMMVVMLTVIMKVIVTMSSIRKTSRHSSTGAAFIFYPLFSIARTTSHPPLQTPLPLPPPPLPPPSPRKQHLPLATPPLLPSVALTSTPCPTPCALHPTCTPGPNCQLTTTGGCSLSGCKGPSHVPFGIHPHPPHPSSSISNLSARCSADPVYEDGVYPLHLPKSTGNQYDASHELAEGRGLGLDVVFVHGIRGEQFRTWTSEGGMWPLWLAEVMLGYYV